MSSALFIVLKPREWSTLSSSFLLLWLQVSSSSRYYNIHYFPSREYFLCCLLVFFCVDHFFPKLWIFRQDRIDVPQKHRQKPFSVSHEFSCQCVVYWPFHPPDICHSETLEAVFWAASVLTHLCLCRFCFLEWHFQIGFHFYFPRENYCHLSRPNPKSSANTGLIVYCWLFILSSHGAFNRKNPF